MTILCALDLGNKVNGVVVFDGDTSTIRFMEAVDTKDLDDVLSTQVIPMLLHAGPDNVVILYENSYVFAKKNKVLMRLQRKVRKMFVDQNFKHIKALLPSQKSGITSGKNRDRKKSAVHAAKDFLVSLGNCEWMVAFDNMKPRNHDVADALLMIAYIIEKDDPILTTTQVCQERTRPCPTECQK